MKPQADKSTRRTIILNGRKLTVPFAQLSYDELVMLAAGPVAGEDERVFTISYFNGPGKRSGGLARGEAIKLVSCVVFTVMQTNNRRMRGRAESTNPNHPNTMNNEQHPTIGGHE